LEGLLKRVIGLSGEQRDCVLDALAGALAEQIEDIEDGLQVAGARTVVELVAQAVEAGDIAGREVHAVYVECVQVPVEDRRRHGVIEPRQRVVQLLDELGHIRANSRMLRLDLKRR